LLRAGKAKVVDDLHAALKGAGAVVVTHYQGLSVPEVTELRVEARKAGATFKVVKNSLARRAAAGTRHANVVGLFEGPTALALSADPVAAARVAHAFARRNDKLKIIGAGLDGGLLDADAVRALAELPPLDDLRARLVALLQTPASRLLAVLQAPGAQVARCLARRGEPGEAAAGEAAAGEAAAGEAG
jgi:large subunit ribosomal protein L10